MRVIDIRNVHQALPEACRMITKCGVDRPSRNGPVRVLDMPLTTLYREPCERVLLWEERDANPFFHLFESLWMLQGRNDLEFVEFFNKGMRSFSDDGKTFNAAYGYRWRQFFGLDQLDIIALALKNDPTCRRQVLGIWDPRHDLGLDSKDLPCNTQVYFQRNEDGDLNMMVTNRSNDAIWGAYGANAVQFSVLQEFMAAKINCCVGEYWQTSFNTHIYMGPHGDLMRTMAALSTEPPEKPACPYSLGQVHAFPLISLPMGRWKRELDAVMKGADITYEDPFICGVALPMLRAWVILKSDSLNRHEEALDVLKGMIAPDWHMACSQWIKRRMKNASS